MQLDCFLYPSFFKGARYCKIFVFTEPRAEKAANSNLQLCLYHLYLMKYLIFNTYVQHLFVQSISKSCCRLTGRASMLSWPSGVNKFSTS